MQMITAQQVEAALDVNVCIDLMRDAFSALSNKETHQIVRPVLPMGQHGLIGMMPAYHPGSQSAAVKVISVVPDNGSRGLPSHQGVICLFDSSTGAPEAIVDAEAVTAIRTAAASAAATAALARSDASCLALLGAGAQARWHLEAIRRVRDLTEVRVWNHRSERARAFVEEAGERTGLPVRACERIEDATLEADIVCTLTTAKTPILSARHVSSGTHINAVGACAPTGRELAGDLIAVARVYVDWLPAALVEAGDYVLALKEGAISEGHLLGEIGQVLAGDVPGRTGPDDITVFESLGQAIQDLLAAKHVVKVWSEAAPSGADR